MLDPHFPTPAAAAAACTSAAPASPARIARTNSGNLLAGRRELVIEHAGQEYHLRLTRNDKLILTK